MSLDHILLGMLRRPASGYDLKAAFNEGARHYWSAELSQIYPALKRLESAGLLQSETEPSPKGPDRKVYRRTRKGRQELIRWLKVGPSMGNQRFGYLAQLANFDEVGDLDSTADFLLQLRAKVIDLLSLLEAAEGELARSSDDLSDEQFHDYLCLRMGVTTLKTRVAWCDECVERIRCRQQALAAREAEHA